MFMVLSSWPWSLREFTRFIWWMKTERRVAANPETKPTTWAVSLLINGCCHPHPPSPFVIITQPESWYSFYRPTEGGRLSRPRDYRKSVQPVPKAVHCSSCRDKHNWPWPLTSQSVMPSLNHCDLPRHVVWTTCLRLLLNSAAAGNWTTRLVSHQWCMVILWDGYSSCQSNVSSSKALNEKKSVLLLSYTYINKNSLNSYKSILHIISIILLLLSLYLGVSLRIP